VTAQTASFLFDAPLAHESEVGHGEFAQEISTPVHPGRPGPISPRPQRPPLRSLRHFRFDQSSLVRDPARGIDHIAEIRALAKQAVQSWSTPRPIVALELRGHTDARGADRYNVPLGLRRARTVEQALRAAIRQESLRAGKPAIAARIHITVSSAGEREPIADNRTDAGRSLNRRVDINARHGGVRPTPRRIPPDTDGCGGPACVCPARRESELEGAEFERPRTVRPLPRLSFFQNATKASHRNHFECGASTQARRMLAIANPTGADCAARVGATQYDTGADIINAIERARQCLGQRVQTVHIFSHSGEHGIFGLAGVTVGLYRDEPDAGSRRDGARRVTDLPAAALAEDVVIVLHGCNTAAGTDSIAMAIYRHLSASLRNPRVFGHHNSGCASRDNSWREFSNASPTGARRLTTLAPHYKDAGCCGP
jgi:outer membrane protein OmpA-like peptidoglycan-associated protein